MSMGENEFVARWWATFISERKNVTSFKKRLRKEQRNNTYPNTSKKIRQISKALENVTQFG